MPGQYAHTPQEEDALARVVAAREQAEGMHASFRKKWEHLYGLYRGYNDLKSSWRSAGPRDKDGVLYDAKKGWGAELFIPYSFSTIETIVPRAVSQRPRMLVLPRDEESEDNVESMRLMIDAQQERIDYDLTLQDILKTGMIYGLGISKASWKKEYVDTRKVQRARFPRTLVGRGQYVTERKRVCTFDDPNAEWIDPFNFFWDPYGYSMKTCEWVLQRSWRSHKYVMARLTANPERGRADWSSAAARALKDDDVRRIGGNTADYKTLLEGRLQASGATGLELKGDHLHEVWEFHDGERVITVLDREVLVQDEENPALGEIPFQVYRPTQVPGEMVGIGEIEPIEHLQAELNTMRSQRRDNATLVLMRSFAYDDSLVDADDVEFGPGSLIPVNGDPNAAITQLRVGDIPNSGYQEEASLVNDIQRTTGVDDTVSGADGAGSGATSTATGVQLVQAAANKRIENKARRLETEVIRPTTRVFGRLNQRMILEDRSLRVDNEEYGSDPNAKRWKWYELGPDDLRGEFDFIPEGGSTQPENTPQLRQDAQMKWQMFGGNDKVDQTWLLEDVMKGLGIDKPKIVQGESLSPSILEKLVAAGVPQELVQLAVQQAQAENPAEGQQPSAQEPPEAAAA